MRRRPLSTHARDVLADLRRAPRPAQEINPGVVDKLVREGLAELYEADTPYRSRTGRIQWIRAITPDSPSQ